MEDMTGWRKRQIEDSRNQDDEFERIEMEQRVRQREPSPIPLITDEEWKALNAQEE
jgi:hypothetical protein